MGDGVGDGVGDGDDILHASGVLADRESPDLRLGLACFLLGSGEV